MRRGRQWYFSYTRSLNVRTPLTNHFSSLRPSVNTAHQSLTDGRSGATVRILSAGGRGLWRGKGSRHGAAINSEVAFAGRHVRIVRRTAPIRWVVEAMTRIDRPGSDDTGLSDQEIRSARQEAHIRSFSRRSVRRAARPRTGARRGRWILRR